MAVKSKKAAKPLKKKGAAPSKPKTHKTAPAAKKKLSAAAKPKAKHSPKPAPKAKHAAKPKPAPKKKPAAKPAKKAVAKPKAAPKAAKKSIPAKAAPKAAKKSVPPKAAPKAAKKSVPAKAAVRPVAPAKQAAPSKHAAAPGKPSKIAPPPSAKTIARPAAVPKPRAPRRPRVRPQESGGPVAAWIAQPDQRRPSSFIPAPPRAQSAFSVAAPPASSDRLLRPSDLQGLEQAIRTSPVRVDVEIMSGKTVVSIYPDEINIRVGEGIEWDFRYLSGTDVMVDDVVIEFTKPAPFKTTTFHAKRPGSGRPHRQLSGPANASLVGHTVKYTVRCVDLYKNEIARATPSVIVNP